jgi:hypothetical protein
VGARRIRDWSYHPIVSTGTHTHATSFFRRYLESPRAQRRALGVGLGIFVVGAAALVLVFFRNTGHALPDKASNQPASVDKPQPTVPIDPEIVAVMRKFIATAVARKNLDQAYAIVGPDIRGDLTRAEFEKGNIPVVPYPEADPAHVQYTVDYSYPTQAALEVGLKPAPGHPDIRRLTFFIGFKKIGGHWVVNYWSPRYHPPVPVVQ